MAFRKTWEEIVELIVGRVLTIPVARAILRRSGWRPGTTVSDEVALSWIPPGGFPGDVLHMVALSPFRPPTGEITYSLFGFFRHVFRWETPQYILQKQLLESGFETVPFHDAPDTEIGQYHLHLFPSDQTFPILQSGPASLPARPSFGNQSIPLVTFAARNPDYQAQTEIVPKYSGFDPIPDGVIDGPEDGARSPELLVWESVPAGTWLFPYNVEWFVTKRDLSARPGQYVPRQIKLRTCVVGNPAADLILGYSASSPTGPWTTLVSLNLQPGGPRSSGWVPFIEGAAAGDVWLALLVRARSSIGVLHVGPIESLMRWAPRAVQLPEEFR